MYESLLFVHSWVRWAILFSLVALFIRMSLGWRRRNPWSTADQHYVVAFSQLFGAQILFGLFIWLSLSPFSKAGFKEPALLLNDSVISFWGLRHGLTMIFAMIVIQTLIVKSRSWAALTKFKAFSLAFGFLIFVVCTAIPWPGLSYGRDLFRWWFW